ncbi:MAG: TonB-dependent receptor, partial [Bryobacterales bacterium]|nr:TonB-dependent receptor [Bryobacterales bacterium]
MRDRPLAAVAAAAFAILLMLPSVGYAQVSTASINGTVTDAQNAVMTGVQLVLTNLDTNVELRTTTNDAGLYRFQNLVIGRYTLSASSQGFTTKRVEQFQLSVGQEATLDFKLTVGSVSEQVTVEASAVGVQSSTAELGSVVEHKQIVDIPISGRNFTALLLLQPGVNASAVSGSQSLSYTRTFGTVYNPSVNGQNNRANMYLLDGVVNIETFGNAYAIPPILDTIQEFKVQSHNDSSDIGMAAGGTINVATKSGTNDLHGTAWEFMQNDAMNARNAFQPTVNPNKQHQYGVSAGGPIMVPKVYDGRNHAFFFVGWEGYRQRRPAFSYFNVPTDAMLNGDFSAGFNNTVRNIYDPSSTRANPDGTFTRDMFAGNKIPTSRIDSGMLYYFQNMVPRPMNTGRAGFNAVNTAMFTQQQDSYTARGDYMLRQNDMFWFRYSGVEFFRTNPGRVGVASQNDMNAHNMGLSWNHTFGPTSTMQVQFGKSFVQLPDVAAYLNAPSDLASKMGLGAGLIQYGTSGQTLLPSVNVDNWFSGGESNTVNRPGDNWSIKGNYSKIIGNHTFRFGSEFIRADMGMVINYHSVNFREYETSNIITSGSTGNSVASALLNAPYQSTRRDLLESLRFGGAFGAYFSDSWKATSKLTVNFGLRYDYVWIPAFGKVEDNNIYTGNMDTDTGEYWVLKVPG